MAKIREPHVVIDSEFEALIPPLTEDEYKQLKENIYNNCGLRDPIVLWCDPNQRINAEPGERKADSSEYDYLIIDGHNRWRILEELRKEYPNDYFKWDWTTEQFDNREEAMAWMIRNQLGRRNLTAFARTELSLKLKPILAEEAEKRMKAGKADPVPNLAQGKVRDEIAKAAQVSHGTVSKVEKILDKAPEEVKEQLRKGEVSIDRAYNEIREAEQPVERSTKRQRENVRFSFQERVEEQEPLVFTRKETKELYNLIRNNDAQMADLNHKTKYNSDALQTEQTALIDSFVSSFRAIIKRRLEYTTDEITENAIQYAKDKLDSLLNDYYNQNL